MMMCVYVVMRGVEEGLEKAVKYLMPALFVLLVLMVGYGWLRGDFAAAVAYLFKPDFSKLLSDAAPDVILAALGQAFFSLSLGMGAIMAYGAYLPHKASIPGTAVAIAIFDTAVALLAGLAIFPIVFQAGLAADQGPGLIFTTLTVAFGQMPFGVVFGTLFFVLLTVAAWTSAISLLEPVAAWLVEKTGFGRFGATTIAGIAAWTVGVVSALSLNVWSEYTVFGKGFLDLCDYVSANIMLPIGGLLIAIFVGWLMAKETTAEELNFSQNSIYALWRVLVRYIAPTGVFLIFLNAIGVF